MTAGKGMTGYLVVIIGMEGLSDFQHHIIGSIYHIIDGADTIAAKSVFYPFRERPIFTFSKRRPQKRLQ